MGNKTVFGFSDIEGPLRIRTDEKAYKDDDRCYVE